MASKDKIVQKAVSYALKEIQMIDIDGWKKIESNEKELKQITEDAKAAAQAEVDLSSLDEFSQLDQISDANLAEFVTRALSKHLSSDRIMMISKGLQIPTYRLNFRHQSGAFYADITRRGEKYMDSLQLASAKHFETSTAVQIASIVVEAIVLLMSTIGIVVPEEAIAGVAQEVASTIMESKPVVVAVEALKKVWNSGGSGTSKAKAVWEVIKEVWGYRTERNIFWMIVKGICRNMSWLDWTKTVAVVTATVVAAVGSDGAALVAKLILAINGAYEFGKKLANLKELDEIKLMVGV